MLGLAVWAKILKLIGGGLVSGVLVEMVGRVMEGVGNEVVALVGAPI